MNTIPTPAPLLALWQLEMGPVKPAACQTEPCTGAEIPASVALAVLPLAALIRRRIEVGSHLVAPLRIV